MKRHENEGYVYLYQVDYNSPEHKFIGTTKNPAFRRRSHEDGSYCGWTTLYGMKKFTVLNRFKSKDEARTAAFKRIQSLEEQGYKVFGTGKSLGSEEPDTSGFPVTKLPPVEKPDRSRTVEYLQMLKQR